MLCSNRFLKEIFSPGVLPDKKISSKYLSGKFYISNFLNKYLLEA